MRLNGCSLNGASLNGGVSAAEAPRQIQTIFIPEPQAVVTAKGLFTRKATVRGVARVMPIQLSGRGAVKQFMGTITGSGRLRRFVGAPKIVVSSTTRNTQRVGLGSQTRLLRGVVGRAAWDMIRVEGSGRVARAYAAPGRVELEVVLQVSLSGWREIIGSAEVHAPKVEPAKRKNLTLVAVALALAEASSDRAG